MWQPGLLPADLRHRQLAANLSGQQIGHLGVSRDRLHGASYWIGPERVSPTLALEIAAMPPKVLEQ